MVEKTVTTGIMKLKLRLTSYLIVAALGIYAGHTLTPPRIITKTQMIEWRSMVKISDPLPVKHGREAWVNKQRDILAAAVPASALREGK